MEDIEQAISGVLSDPDLMQKIMGMAQALGGGGETTQSAPETAPPIPDLSGLSQLTGLLGKAGIDSDQKNLLSALGPYMSSGRIAKLRRAMEAARLAELATSMMGKGSDG